MQSNRLFPSGSWVRSWRNQAAVTVTAAWFRQDLTQLPEGKSLFDCIGEVRQRWTRGAIQSHLGCFGFSGEEVERSTSVLSGGERARMALAILTLARANLLVLD